jgi:hypothetical protein
MRHKRSKLHIAITMAALLSFNAQNVSAQDTKNALFLPTSAWLVGPAAFQGLPNDVKVPCVMTNQFDNGYNLRISGTDTNIMAVAVDFRRQLFEKGQSYDLGFKIGTFERILSSTAHDETTLVVNTDQSEEMRSAMHDGKRLVVTFGKTGLPFSLAGARDGLSRMASCYSGARVIENEPSGQNHAVSPSVEPIPIPQISATGLTPKPEGQAENVSEASAELDNTATNADDNVGALLDSFLENAENEAKTTQTTEQVQSNQQVDKVARSFPDESLERPKVVMDTSTNIEPRNIPLSAPGAMKWEAQQGGNLKDVLNIWTSHKKVGLLWGVTTDYYLPRPFYFEGRFEDAVRALMMEFAEDRYRPRGKLYNDAEKGRAFLLVEYDNGG